LPDIKTYETMAMLDLTEGERELLDARLDALTESFAELERIDTDDAEPLVTVLDTQNVLREDVALKLVTREELLANAPQQCEGYYQVPGTL
jgi:aspartyl-tRNA(Asn)/glutamyl-tRNA(Gln) amidotransferase subunit C